MINLFTFLLGSVIGSFLNVCILRWPQDQSIVKPRSHCPSCGAFIKPYDNVPILSYLILKGRCRACGTSISVMYPVVELLTGLFFLFCGLQFGYTLETLKYFILGSGLIVLIFSDIKFRLLPDQITIYGTFVGLLLSLKVWIDDDSFRSLISLNQPTQMFIQRTARALADSWAGNYLGSGSLYSVLGALCGALFGGGILFLLGELYYWIRKEEGLGMGDVKMMTMIGAFFGFKLTFVTIMLGSLLGSVVGVLGMLFLGRDMKYQLPFGTFLGTAALILALAGKPILQFLFH
ncbi:MAG: prepilin peptidase [Acidobacteriia bacterium]|nr:prepilin peptidase [Terriglobia bacterium]